MEFSRQIVDSSLLEKIFLPPGLKNKKVEIIILPLDNVDEDSKPKKSIENFIGMLSKYKNPDLIPFEKNAWQEALEYKHGNC